MINLNSYVTEPHNTINVGKKSISVFEIGDENIDHETVSSFGEEWSKFSSFSEKEIQNAGDQYFDIVPLNAYTGKYVLDVGCGTGRWSKYLSRKVGALEAIDPSDAVYSAAALLQDEEHVRITRASADNIPFPDNSFDLVFSLGVLHHIPDTHEAMRRCVEKVKPGGYFLVYLYYNFENRGLVFKSIFHISNVIRRVVSILPSAIKSVVCDILAVLFYLPFVLVTKLMKAIGLAKVIKYIPLSYYADKSMNIIRNDSLDRFGTPLEQRYSRAEIEHMMTSCGLTNITFSTNEPFWHAIGQKR